MHHDIIRVLTALDVDAAWYGFRLSSPRVCLTHILRYVPNPSPAVFRTMKNNHNILQGVVDVDADLKLTVEAKAAFDTRILKTVSGGPLRVVPRRRWRQYRFNRWVFFGLYVQIYLRTVLDDPRMTGLIPPTKKTRTDLPIIHRSHFETHGGRIHKKGYPQEEVWEYIWNNIKHADLFSGCLVRNSAPADVPVELQLFLVPPPIRSMD